MMAKLRLPLLALAALLLGALGWLVTGAVAHLYLDHQRLDQVWELELRRAQAAQQTGVK